LTSGKRSRRSLTSARTRALLAGVLERIIPAGGGFPGAGDLGVADFVADAGARSQAERALLARGLDLIESCARSAHSAGFAGLPDEHRDQVLRRVEAEDPAFFSALVRHAYRGYYSNARVVDLLGAGPRSPQPLGYRLDPFDERLLEPVKKRGRVYKQV